MQVTFMLVGEQTIPNLMPFLQTWPETPNQQRRRLVILVTTRTNPLEFAIENIRRFLLARFHPVIQQADIIRVEGDKHDLQVTLTACRAVLTRLQVEAAAQHEKLELIFNMTSGTKIMALAFYQLASESGGQLIYLDSNQNCILQVLPSADSRPLTQSLTIAEYLAAHGYLAGPAELAAASYQPGLARSQAASLLAQTSPEIVTKLAGWLRTSEKQLLTLPVEPSQPSDLFRRLNGLLWQIEDETPLKLQFKWLESSNFFPGGKWLEQYAFDCAFGLIPYLRDVQAGLTISAYTNPQIENELDLVFSRGQHLTLCSCKVGSRPDTEWLAELISRARLLGTFSTKILLVNFNTARFSTFQARAQDNQVRLLDSRALPNLTEHFARLI